MHAKFSDCHAFSFQLTEMFGLKMSPVTIFKGYGRRKQTVVSLRLDLFTAK